MKVFLPLLLAALLGVEQAHCLMCFTCQNQKSNWYCLKPTICSDTDSYCVTVSASIGLKNLVGFSYSLHKFCSRTCGSSSVSIGVASMDMSCCQSFLCNISAADGVLGLRAGPGASAQPAGGSAVGWTLTARPRLPKLRKEGKPRPKRISKPPPLTPHPASPTFLALGPHRQAWPPVPTPASSPYSRSALPGEPGNGAWASGSQNRVPGTRWEGLLIPGPPCPQVQKMCCVDRCVVHAPSWACVSVFGGGMGVRSVSGAPSASTEPQSLVSLHMSLSFHSLRGWPFGETGLPLFPGLGYQPRNLLPPQIPQPPTLSLHPTLLLPHCLK